MAAESFTPPEGFIKADTGMFAAIPVATSEATLPNAAAVESVTPPAALENPGPAGFQPPPGFSKAADSGGQILASVGNGSTPDRAVNDPSLVLDPSERFKMNLGTGAGAVAGQLDYLKNKFGSDNVKTLPNGDNVVRKDNTWIHTSEQDPWSIAGAVKRGGLAALAPDAIRMGFNIANIGAITAATVASGGSATVPAVATAAAIDTAAQAYMNNLGKVYGTYKVDDHTQEMKDLSMTMLGNLAGNSLALGTLPNAKWIGDTISKLGEQIGEWTPNSKGVLKSIVSASAGFDSDAAHTLIENPKVVGAFISKMGDRSADVVKQNAFTAAKPAISDVVEHANAGLVDVWDKAANDIVDAVANNVGSPESNLGPVLPSLPMAGTSAIAEGYKGLADKGLVTLLGKNGQPLRTSEDILAHGLDGITPRWATEAQVKMANPTIGSATEALTSTRKMFTEMQQYSQLAKQIERAPSAVQTEKLMDMRQGLKASFDSIASQTSKADSAKFTQDLSKSIVDNVTGHIGTEIDKASNGAFTKLTQGARTLEAQISPISDIHVQALKLQPGAQQDTVLRALFDKFTTRGDASTALQAREAAQAVTTVNPMRGDAMSKALLQMDAAKVAIQSASYIRTAGTASKVAALTGLFTHPVGTVPLLAATSPRLTAAAATTILPAMRSVNAAIAAGGERLVGAIGQNPQAAQALLSLPGQLLQQKAQVQQALQQKVQQVQQQNAQFQQQQQQMQQHRKGR